MIYFRYTSRAAVACWRKPDGTLVYPTEISVSPEELVQTIKTITFGRPDANLVVTARGYVHDRYVHDRYVHDRYVHDRYVHDRYVLSVTSTRMIPGHPADCGSLGFGDPPDWLVGAVNGIVPPAPEVAFDGH